MCTFEGRFKKEIKNNALKKKKLFPRINVFLTEIFLTVIQV